MSEVKLDPVLSATKQLREFLESPQKADASAWAEDVRKSLGQLATAIQSEVQRSEGVRRDVGEINPDLQNSPTTERHIETSRVQFIQLGEKIHQLRADMNQPGEVKRMDTASVRRRATEIIVDAEATRKADDTFLLDAVNSNPGSGE